jgi:hypothetical protein
MTIAIIESGMTFGFYPDGHCFCIEAGETVKKINKTAKKGDGVKIAEFLLLETKSNKTTIYIVEAKTNPPPDEEQLRLKDFIEDIKQKLSNSLALFIAIYLNRHVATDSRFPNAELSDYFRQLELSKVDFLLILVIKNCKKENLQQIQDTLHKALKSTLKIWNLSLSTPSVIVLNEEKARKRGLVYRPHQ